MFSVGALHSLAASLLPRALGRLGAPLGGPLARLPPCFAWLGVEARLGAESALDLAVSLEPSPLARIALAGALADEGAPVPAAWGPTIAWMRGWARGPLLGRPSTLWLEVDSDRGGGPPVLFATTLGLGPAEIQGIAAQMLDGPRDPAVVAAVREEVAWLGRRAAIHHLADLRPRGLDAIRVVASVGRQGLDELLDRLQWPDDRDDIAALVAALGELADPLTIDVDLGVRGRRRLGVECHLPTDPGADRRWWPIFAHAERAAGAAPRKLDALYGWPKRHVLGDMLVIHRHLHLKFTLSGAAAPTVKAYLGVRPEPVALARPALGRAEAGPG